MGLITNLFYKPEKGSPLSKPDDGELLLRARYGIKGDANAGAIGPRQVLLVSGETLREFGLQPGDLRENVVVDGVALDDLPSGSVLKLGSSATVRLTYHCEVCKYIGKFGTDLVKALVNRRGFLAVVLQGGQICEGDSVDVLAEKYAPIADRTMDRFFWLVAQIPYGKVISYKQILNVLGVSRSYYRVLPNYMKRIEDDGYPLHRIVDSKGYLVSHLEGQKVMLQSEDVEISDHWVDESVYGWDVRDVYY